MAPPYSWDALTQIFSWIPGVGSNWRPPVSDDVRDRYVDRSQVASTEPFAWPKDFAGLPLAIGSGQQPYQGSVGGIPVQRIPALEKNRVYRTYTENNTYAGTVRQVRVPVPPSGEWVEGNPTNPGAWDKHCVFVCPETGESWEMIGVDPRVPACLAYGHFRNGVLVDGFTVCAGRQSMAPLLSVPGDPSHRRFLVLPDYVGWDGSKHPDSGYPSIGDVFALSATAAARLRQGATVEQLAYIDDLEHKGARLCDRGPFAGISASPSPKWATSSLPGLKVTVGDLVRVTASA